MLKRYLIFFLIQNILRKQLLNHNSIGIQSFSVALYKSMYSTKTMCKVQSNPGYLNYISKFCGAAKHFIEIVSESIFKCFDATQKCTNDIIFIFSTLTKPSYFLNITKFHSGSWYFKKVINDIFFSNHFVRPCKNI